MTSLQHIPRTCFYWLFFAQLALMGAHFAELPWWIWPVWGLCYGWRLMIYYGRLGFPKTYVKTMLAVVGLMGLSKYFDSMIDISMLNAVLVLAFLLKLLELKQKRDVYVALFLGYFLIASHFLFYQGLPHAALAALCLILLLSSQVALHTSHAPPRWKPMRLACQMMVQALPIMVILFIIFPRLGPMWSVKFGGEQTSIGLSDKVSPGDVTRLARRSELAFRASFADGRPPAPKDLYWRALVLSEFDGASWRPYTQHTPSGQRRFIRPRPNPPPAYEGRRVSYSVIAEPSRQRWLFALPWAISSTPGVNHMPDRVLQARWKLFDRFQYDVTSYLDAPNTTLDEAARQRHLAFPTYLNRRSQALAKAWRAEVSSDRAFVQGVLQFYRQEPFAYTLNPPPLGVHKVDDFIFETQRGFCEHYASSFAFLMRAAGIPARVVAGYQGGKANPYENYLLVYQYDAHAWAEVWLEPHGWVRVDPTAAVAPHRIELGSERALAAEENFLADSPFSPVRLQLGWLRNLQLRADQLNFLWYRWVLSYDAKRQRKLYRNWLDNVPEWQSLVLGLGLIALPIALLALWMHWRRRPLPRAAADRLWMRLSQHCARANLARRHGEGPTHYIARLQTAYPAASAELNAFLEAYVAVAYREQAPKKTYLNAMRSLLQRIKSIKL